MYKLLIIDDEYLVREGLKMTIDWAANGIEIVGEASNGLQGFEEAMRLNPDLIISDVRMPVMTGVELAVKLKQNNFTGKIIILSGYRDFEYAKSSFENGVVAYVLKPVDNDELVAAIKGALRQLQQEVAHQALISELSEQLPVVKQQYIRDLFNGHIRSLEEIEKKEKILDFHLPSRGFLVSMRSDDEAGTGFSFSLLQKCINDHIDNEDNVTLILDQRLYIFIEKTSNEVVADKIRMVLEEYERLEDETVSVSICQYSSLLSLASAHKISEDLLNSKLMIGLNTIALENSPIGRYRKTITDALAYISHHYADDITVKRVAEELQVSESHLMHQFKEETDKTFNEILTDYRLLVARKLLRNGSYRVNEVSYLVGYHDVKYFSLVFSRKFNILPSAYMEQYR
ncbi:MAG: response regulator [Bacilli bacterium]|jgi:two-component system response regulator YesN|nr:response regulator [Bacilli bacterium]MCH4202575.1 response regulator [Bacilli bacterium]MCH4235694.1 response regulator [Bacilli bacterium]